MTIESLRDLLNIPEDGARRIIGSLANDGLVYELSLGVWTRTLNLPSGHGV